MQTVNTLKRSACCTFVKSECIFVSFFRRAFICLYFVFIHRHKINIAHISVFKRLIFKHGCIFPRICNINKDCRAVHVFQAAATESPPQTAGLKLHIADIAHAVNAPRRGADIRPLHIRVKARKGKRSFDIRFFPRCRHILCVVCINRNIRVKPVAFIAENIFLRTHCSFCRSLRGNKRQKHYDT